MSEIIIVYCSGLLTIPVLQYLVVPYAKKKIKERWNNEEETEVKTKKHGGGRPLGSKNKPKEKKEC